jgi:curved DNA-binding protein CbpA
MKLDSKYFDCVRIRPDRAEPAAQSAVICQWKGCHAAGAYRAPMGRGREGRYYLFCLDHVRQFNATYNYFAGMSNAEVEAYQKESAIGHRPTWKLSGGSLPPGLRERIAPLRHARNPHAFFSWGSPHVDGADPPRRALRPLEVKSLEAMNLSIAATRIEIKARFKELVKRHHPDANGGDTRSEDKLREIIQAYNYLKQAGLV